MSQARKGKDVWKFKDEDFEPLRLLWKEMLGPEICCCCCCCCSPYPCPGFFFFEDKFHRIMNRSSFRSVL